MAICKSTDTLLKKLFLFFHELLFKRHLSDSLGSLEETKSWLNFARDSGYLVQEKYETLIAQFDTLGSKIYTLHENWN
jgi:four helix bundle protein